MNCHDSSHQFKITLKMYLDTLIISCLYVSFEEHRINEQLLLYIDTHARGL